MPGALKSGAFQSAILRDVAEFLSTGSRSLIAPTIGSSQIFASPYLLSVFFSKAPEVHSPL
jgi:hypothetical protein